MPGRSPDDIFGAAFGRVSAGTTPDDAFAGAFGTGDPNIDPNNLERVIGEFVQDKPTLQRVMGSMGLPGSAVSNVLQGNFGSAAKNVGQFAADAVDAVLPGDWLPNDITEDKDRTSFKDVLTNTLGIKGNLGEFDVPLIGRVTGKGALGLIGDIVTDPLVYAKPFGLTAKGAAAAKVGKLKPARIAESGKTFLSDLGAQGATGQRSLLAFQFPGMEGAQTIIRGQKALDLIGRARMEFGASLPGRAFSTTGRYFGIGRTSREAGLTKKAEVTGGILNRYQALRGIIEEQVVKAGGNFDDVRQIVGEVVEGRRNATEFVPQVDRATERAIQADLARVGKEIDKQLDSAGRLSKAEMDKARDFLLDNPDLIGDPNAPFIGIMSSRTNSVFEEILSAEQKLGVSIEALGDPALNYYFRSITPEARKVLADRNLRETLFSKLDGVIGQKSGKARTAAFEGRPIEEINSWWEKQPNAKGTKLFETDPDKVLAARVRQTAGHAETAGAITKAMELFGVDATQARMEIGNYMKAEDVFKAAGLPKARLGNLAGKALPPDVARELARVVRVTKDPMAPSSILKAIDASLSIMKTGSTSIFPAFHARNAISNVWANFLAGVWRPERYKQAGSIVWDMRKIKKHGGDGNIWTIGGRKLSTRDLMTEMSDHRILGFGQVSIEELGNFASKNADEWAATRVAKAPFRGGRKAGEMVEDHAKIAHYIDKLENGFNPESAAASVKKYLFDYGDLTTVEKNLMKRVVPFYTFFRKNLPLQLESMLTKPGKVSAVAHAQRALQANREDESPLNTAFIPEWTRRRLFGVNRDKDGSIRTISGLGIGLEELAMLDKPVTEFLAMLRPELKGALQQATGQDLFREIPLSKSDYAPSVLRFMPDAFLKAIDFKVANADKGSYRANPKFLNWLNSGMGGISRSLGTIHNVEKTFAPDAKPEELPQNLLRLGIGFREARLSPEEQKRRNAWALVKLYEQHLEEQIARGNVKKFDVYSVRRDTLGVDDPQAQRLRALQRELAKIRKAAIALGDDRAGVQRGGLRSGGQ